MNAVLVSTAVAPPRTPAAPADPDRLVQGNVPERGANQGTGETENNIKQVDEVVTDEGNQYQAEEETAQGIITQRGQPFGAQDKIGRHAHDQGNKVIQPDDGLEGSQRGLGIVVLQAEHD